MITDVPSPLDGLPRFSPIQQEKMDNFFEGLRLHMLSKTEEKRQMRQKESDAAHTMRSKALL